MITIKPAQVEKFEELARIRFLESLTSMLEDKLPDAVAQIRSTAEPHPTRDVFEKFIDDCVASAESIEIEEDADIAVFTTMVILAEVHASAYPELFNYAFHALSRDGKGRLRVSMIEDRFAEATEQRPEIKRLLDIFAIARERFA